jgi:hypothetical protein
MRVVLLTLFSSHTAALRRRRRNVGRAPWRDRTLRQILVTGIEGVSSGQDRRRQKNAQPLIATKGVVGMLIQMIPTGAVLTLTTAAALAYGMYDGNYRGNLIEIGNRAPSCVKPLQRR